LTTWYLITNLPAPDSDRSQTSTLTTATLEEVVRLYGLRMWVEQSYKQVKGALGWVEYQVRSDRAIRRHWALVCCAFAFCWWHTSHTAVDSIEQEPTPEPTTLPPSKGAKREKKQREAYLSASKVMARSAATGAGVVGALDHVGSVLASVVNKVPLFCKSSLLRRSSVDPHQITKVAGEPEIHG